MDIDEEAPRGSERLAEVADELRSHLPDGLRLARELADVVAVIDTALAKSPPRLHQDVPTFVTPRTYEFHVSCCDVRHDRVPCPFARDPVHGAFHRHERASRHF